MRLRFQISECSFFHHGVEVGNKNIPGVGVRNNYFVHGVGVVVREQRTPRLESGSILVPVVLGVRVVVREERTLRVGVRKHFGPWSQGRKESQLEWLFLSLELELEN